MDGIDEDLMTAAKYGLVGRVENDTVCLYSYGKKIAIDEYETEEQAKENFKESAILMIRGLND